MEQKKWTERQTGYSGTGKHRIWSVIVPVERLDARPSHPLPGNKNVDSDAGGGKIRVERLDLKPRHMAPPPCFVWGQEVDPEETPLDGGL